MERGHKQLIIMLFDTLVFIGSFILSYLILEPIIRVGLQELMILSLISLIFYLTIGHAFHLFNKIIRYTSIKDAVIQTLTIFASYAGSVVLLALFGRNVSLRFTFLALVSSLILILSSRLLWRLSIEHVLKRQKINNLSEKSKLPVRTLVIGAGEGGQVLLKRLENDPSIKFVGIVDDNKKKNGTYIHSIPVLGTVADAPSIIKEKEIEQVTIAIPSIEAVDLKRIIEILSPTNVKINQMPPLEDILLGNTSSKTLREVEVADLLGRDEVELDMDSIANQVTGKVILITGAGGSIGSELTRQLLRFSPKSILLLGHGEFSIYKIHRELMQLEKNGIDIVPIIADIQDKDRIDSVMAKYRPDIVYHAAAHKHVPLMEANPTEAIKNNIFGTQIVAEAAKKYKVKNFVMVSTDKAVNPPNTMGATKRVAEMIVTGLNEKGSTKFVAVRFGNVLNSRGSVIPVFKEQLERGGPLTITDFRMTRYFMTIPEASKLVLQAGALANGGEIFVLDMGDPVRIYDLARNMILLSGANTNDVQIVEVGIRPGEKLYEELLTESESISEQIHDKIYVGRVTNQPQEVVQNFISSLDSMSDEEKSAALVEFANKGCK